MLRPWQALGALLLAALMSGGVGKAAGESAGSSWSFAIDAPDWLEPDWSELDRLGFLVMRGWVRADVAEWSRQLSDNWINKGFTQGGPFTLAPHTPAMTSTEAAVMRLLHAIRTSARTPLQPDTIVHFDTKLRPHGSPEWRPNYKAGNLSLYFFTGNPPNRLRKQQGYTFHTDIATAWGRFRPPRGGADLLNFYMPVHKPSRDDSNLLVLPWTAVPEAERQWLEGGLARVYRPLGGKRAPTVSPGQARLALPQSHVRRELIDASCNDTYRPTGRWLSEELLLKQSVSPPLGPGDLLILRGDTVHASGPGRPKHFRLALSIRASSRAFELSERSSAFCVKRYGPFPVDTCEQGGPAFARETRAIR